MVKHTHNLLIAGVLLSVMILLTGCSSEPSMVEKNKPVPGFKLLDLQGQTVSFPQQFAKQVTIISFWADWCPSCYKEMRDFDRIYQQYHAQGLVILAINIKQDRATASSFIEDLDLSYPVLLDSNGDIAKKYAVTSLPAAFIVDRNGRLDTRVLGETPPEVFEKILAPLL